MLARLSSASTRKTSLSGKYDRPMAKTLFAVGANTHGLQYAEHDVDLLGRAFKRHDYKVVTLKGASKSIITETFDELREKAMATDTLVVYFSGHAIIEGGDLQFIVADGAATASKKLNLNHLVQDLATTKTMHHKLLVVDT